MLKLISALNYKFITTALTAILLWMSPIAYVFLVVGILTAVDFITGIIAARKRKEDITSKGFRRSIEKIGIYSACLIAGHTIQTFVLQIPGFDIPKLLMIIISGTELKSIDENQSELTGVSLFEEVIKLLERSKNRKKDSSKQQSK